MGSCVAKTTVDECAHPCTTYAAIAKARSPSFTADPAVTLDEYFNEICANGSPTRAIPQYELMLDVMKIAEIPLREIAQCVHARASGTM